MPSAQDGLPITQFGTIKFPCETHTLENEPRIYIHYYPHTPGGNPEKLGRGLYKCTVRGNFQATFPGYPDLYPNSMNTLRSYMEQQLTLPFVHPSVTFAFPATIIGWRQIKDARMLSGEKVDITFLEDQSAQFQLAQQVTSLDDTAIGPSAQRLQQELADVMADLAIGPNALSLFDQIQQVVQSINAVGDTAQLYGNLYGDKLQQLGNLCGQLESDFSMQDARAWPVVNVLLDLWQSSNLALLDLQSKQVQLQTYVVPITEALADIAIAIYGDASRQSDLLGLNPAIADVLNVPAATQIRYYPDTGGASSSTLSSSASSGAVTTLPSLNA